MVASDFVLGIAFSPRMRGVIPRYPIFPSHDMPFPRARGAIFHVTGVTMEQLILVLVIWQASFLC